MASKKKKVPKKEEDELNIGDLKISRMVDTPVTTSPYSSKMNADILLKAGDTILEEVNQEMSDNPKFQYDLVVEKDDAYFNKHEEDDAIILKNEMQRFNTIIK